RRAAWVSIPSPKLGHGAQSRACLYATPISWLYRLPMTWRSMRGSTHAARSWRWVKPSARVSTASCVAFASHPSADRDTQHVDPAAGEPRLQSLFPIGNANPRGKLEHDRDPTRGARERQAGTRQRSRAEFQINSPRVLAASPSHASQQFEPSRVRQRHDSNTARVARVAWDGRGMRPR